MKTQSIRTNLIGNHNFSQIIDWSHHYRHTYEQMDATAPRERYIAYIIGYGSDCDGVSSNYLYGVDCYVEANELAWKFNEGSDGTRYCVVGYGQAREFCNDLLLSTEKLYK